jgi:hypothetical protein
MEDKFVYLLCWKSWSRLGGFNVKETGVVACYRTKKAARDEAMERNIMAQHIRHYHVKRVPFLEENE